ncbi:cupin domain-containing protein [Enterococcus sp. 22-H-5-01]|uniref:cupin domain-containing protein n=1 Tax=Enterococcus sp. 22-H-5-01 TaxID=3418555 RepID=UPI003D05952F
MEEFLLLLEGQATFVMNGKKVIAKKGDSIHFPKDTSIEVFFEEKCKVLTIHPAH